MANLHDDRKKEEEEFGGFEPEQEENDETFLLGENGDYPAKLPDNFSDDASDDELEDEQPIEEPEEEIVVSEEPDEPESEEVKAKEEVIDEPEETEPEVENNEEIDEAKAEDEEDSETFDLGDDFKKQLQQNIDQSKARREANATEEDGIEPSGELAMPIGDDADTVVNLSDIDADKPSNYDPNNNIKENDETPKVEEKQEEAITEEKDESKKKTPVWLLMLYSSAATFLLTLGAGFLIWWLMSDSNENQDIEDPQKTEQVAHTDDSHSSEIAHNSEHDSDDHNEMTAADSIDEEEDNWLDSMEAEMDIDAKDTVLKFKEDKELFADLEDKIDKNLEKEKPRKQTTTKPKKKNKTSNVTTENKKKNDLASNNTNSKKTKPKSTTKNSVKIDESQFSMPQPKGPAPETGIFTVQIYSSPSKIDAESWLGQLKAREIPYAMIVEKEIRGKTWYRVRYGKFETKDAARASALELGYSQSWIDRVE
ncbi:MAG: SPOR domain-containing protein [Chlorobiota bacterium]